MSHRGSEAASGPVDSSVTKFNWLMDDIILDLEPLQPLKLAVSEYGIMGTTGRTRVGVASTLSGCHSLHFVDGLVVLQPMIRMQKRLKARFWREQGLPVLIWWGVCSVAVAASADDGLLASQTQPFDPKSAPMRLRVAGHQLLTEQGKMVRLRGVNIASLEWSDRGDHLAEAFEQALRQWKADLIRMPLAQDRWFGKTPGQHDGGAAYRDLVDKLVATCAGAGGYLDLDLHWSDCGKWADEGGRLAQHPMPDAHSILFWRDVAVRYRNHPQVIFGLYNEPHDVPWTVWRDGGQVTEPPPKRATNQPPIVYQAAGLQQLYDTVRAVGAGNVVTASGLDWGYDLRGLSQGYALSGTNILYETHPYPQKQDWDTSFGQVCRDYAVYVGEWGGRAKDLEYAQRLWDYMNRRGLSWTAWCFHPFAGPTLIRNWKFEATEFGQFVKDALGKQTGD